MTNFNEKEEERTNLVHLRSKKKTNIIDWLFDRINKTPAASSRTPLDHHLGI